MVKAIRTISGKSPILTKLVFELRYNYGFTYLDRCGRTVNTIMRNDPAWTLAADQPSPQNAPLVSLLNKCLFSFTARSLNLSLEQPTGGDPIGDEDVPVFVQQCQDVCDVVVDHLGLEDFSRIGFRAWYTFPATSQEDSENWLLSLEAASPSRRVIDAFGGQLDAMGVALVIKGSDRIFRIAFNGVQRAVEIQVGDSSLAVRPKSLPTKQRSALMDLLKKQKREQANPQFAAVIDIDAYQEEPTVVRPHDFCTSSFATFLPRLYDLFSTSEKRR